MASAIDDCPVWVLVSLKRVWHSPLEAYTLCLAWYRASTSREENANGQLTHLRRTATEPRRARAAAALDVSPHHHLGVSRCATASRSLGSGA